MTKLQRTTSYFEELYCKVPFISGISFFLLSILSRASTLESIQTMNFYTMKPRDLMIPTFLGLSTYFISKRLKIRKKREIFLFETYRQISDAIIIANNKGRIDYINPVAEDFYNISLKDARGQSIDILKSNLTPDSTYIDMLQTLKRGDTWHGLFTYKKEEVLNYGDVKVFPIKDEKGLITDYIGVKRDVTEKKLLEERLEKMAKYDDLTGLLNRIPFCETGNFFIKESMRNLNPLFLFFIDLDGFKLVNDTYGHLVGDVVLVETAGRLKKIMHRDSDLISRYGGDEFVALISNKNEDNIDFFAKRIISEINLPYVIEGAEINIGASVGVVPIFPINKNIILEDMLKFADNAMYDAKKLGKNNYVILSASQIA